MSLGLNYIYHKKRMRGNRSGDTPPWRVYASYVPIFVGCSAKRSLQEVLNDLRKQRNGPQPIKNQLVDGETFATLVGLIHHHFTHPAKYHLEFLHNYIGEDHTQQWYDQLYSAIKKAISAIDYPTVTHEIALTPDVVLCGKPYAIEDGAVVDLKKVKAFEHIIRDEHKVQIMCYMKICNLKKGILRQVCGAETHNIAVEWDSDLWKKVKTAILANIKLL
jgi:hypothetical protein